MAFAFEKLIVYQKAVDFADKICTATSKFPNGYYFLRDQLNRASLSISANIAEATDGLQKMTENISLLYLAALSMNVCLCWNWPPDKDFWIQDATSL